MAAQQTSYALEAVENSQPGFISNTGPKTIVPFRNDNASPLPFGILVCKSTDTDDRGADMPAVARQVLGVSVFNQKHESSNGCPSKEMLDICQQGEVRVSTSATVTPDDPVRITLATGVFCTTASAGNTALVEGAKFVSRATGAGTVKLFINNPGAVKLTAD